MKSEAAISPVRL